MFPHSTLSRSWTLAVVLVLLLAAGPALAQDEIGFGFDDVVREAQARARQAYRPPQRLGGEAAKLDYDAYRRITFVREREDLSETDRFRLQFAPRGALFNEPVEISLVSNGEARPRAYSPNDFRFYDLPLSEEDKVGLGFSGFRLLSPINEAGKFDEVVSFQGASYFRAVGARNVFGTSARGLALATASPEGEEFPRFTRFWVETPAPDARSVTLYALLDSESVTGAYRFVVRPGIETVMDVEAALFPRRELTDVGLAPLSSMFEFGAQDPLLAKRDYRPNVHDADMMVAQLANGERIVRPLINPQGLEISSFAEEVPRSFGLAQRERDFDAFADLEADYERRPTVTVSPEEGFGRGRLVLVEIPTPNEFNDNIVLFWRPAEAWPADERRNLRYTLRWGLGGGDVPAVAEVRKTRVGQEIGSDRPLFVIDFATGNPELLDDAVASVTASKGSIGNITLRRNTETGGARLSFTLDPEGDQPSELRAVLLRGDEQLSETWLYRWTDL